MAIASYFDLLEGVGGEVVLDGSRRSQETERGGSGEAIRRADEVELWNRVGSCWVMGRGKVLGNFV